MSMQNTRDPVKPTVKLYYSRKLNNDNVISQILYGAEEEGILMESREVDDGNVLDIALKASQESVLGTGIGVSSTDAAVHNRQLPRDYPVYKVSIHSDDETLRKVGINGARIVKRMPLKN